MKQTVLLQTGPLTSAFVTQHFCDFCGGLTAEADCYQKSETVVCYDCAHKVQVQEEGEEYESAQI